MATMKEAIQALTDEPDRRHLVSKMPRRSHTPKNEEEGCAICHL